jgi:hypothetical protein
MPSRNQHKHLEDARQAKKIGERVRFSLEMQASRFSPSAMAYRGRGSTISERPGIPRSDHRYLSSIADHLGCSLEWLVTGKGMPNDQWSKKTALSAKYLS